LQSCFYWELGPDFATIRKGFWVVAVKNILSNSTAAQYNLQNVTQLHCSGKSEQCRSQAE